MQRFLRRFDHTGDPFSVLRIDDDALGQEYAWIEAAERLEAEEAALVHMADKEADLVHVGGDEDGWATAPALRRDEVAEAGLAHLVDQRPDRLPHDVANLVREPGHARGGGKAW